MSSHSPEISSLTDPFLTFQTWMKDAELSGEKAPEAMSVATSTAKGLPSVRILLLKHFDENGFVFYTNSESRKGIELRENPFAALLFFWKNLDRQVRIEGSVSMVSPEEADAYFKTRPRLSRIGAHASDQSRILPSRDILEKRLEVQQEIYENEENVPRPPHWNGYRVKPDRFEFWEAQPFRLHHRTQFHRKSDSRKWEKELLYP